MTSIVNSLTGGSIDIQSLAKNLTDAERAPRQAMLDARKTTAENRISSIGRIYAAANEMKVTIAGFGDAKALAFQPRSSDESKASFTFKKYPPPGNVDFSFKVNRLATVNSVTLAPLELDAPLVPSPDLTTNSTIKFTGLPKYASVTVGGLTLKATANMTAAEVAAAFASVSDGRAAITTKGVFSGSLTGWSPAAAANDVVTFSNNSTGEPVGDGTPAALPNRVLHIYAGTREKAAGADPIASFNMANYTSLEALRDAIKATTNFDANILTKTMPGSSSPNQRYLTITHGSGVENNFFVQTETNDHADPLTGSGAPADGLHVQTRAADANTDPGQSYGLNAQIESDGIISESSTNSFSKLISGLDVDVKAVTGGGTVRLYTSSDMETFTTALRSIVSTFNSLMTTISNEVKYDTDIKKRGGLANDFVAKNFMQQMSRVTTSPINTSLGKLTLADIGVRTNLDGSLSIDEDVLSSVKKSNPEYISAVMASTATTKGALETMANVADTVLGTKSGFVALYDKTVKTEVPKIEDELATLNTQMDAIQARYLKQFTEMQSILNRTQSTQTSLTNSMAAWTNSLKG